MTGPAQAGLPPGFFVPAEEDRHEATFMMWPVSRKVYPDPAFLRMLQSTITRVANTISAFEPVILLAHPDDHATARRGLSSGVTLWDIPTEDLWARDAGPLIARHTNGQRLLSHVRFNGWGRKQVHRRDGKVAAEIAVRLGFERVDSGLQGEAGGVEQDGHGLLMAHESSWVIANRNPGQSRADVGRRLIAAYGAKDIIWSKGVRGHDITDYHIDSLARFSGPGRVLINLPDDPDMSDPFHRAAFETYDVLTAANLQVDVIPEPNRRRVKSFDFVASYVNYYVCNGAVIAAQFGDPDTDKMAQAALARHYPGRQIVTLDADPLGEVGGGIHCATQQLPAA